MADRRTQPSQATREAEREEAHTKAGPGSSPTPEEERDAPTSVGKDVEEHYEEMIERGADQKGEGRLP